MKKFDPRENLPLKYVALLSAMLIVMTMNPPPRLQPTSPLTMMLALVIMEAMSGTLYLAVFIASIVSQKHETPTDKSN